MAVLLVLLAGAAGLVSQATAQDAPQPPSAPAPPPSLPALAPRPSPTNEAPASAAVPAAAPAELRVCCWNIRNFGVTEQFAKGRRFRGMKVEEEIAALCATVKKLRPDVLAVQEIVTADNDTYLLLLQQRLREAGVDYPHITTARGGDMRIQCALLSRLPFVQTAHRTDDTYEVLRRSTFPGDAALATPGGGSNGTTPMPPADTEASPVAREGVTPTVPLARGGGSGTSSPSQSSAQPSPGSAGQTNFSPGGSAPGGAGTTTAILLLNRAILHAVIEPMPGRRIHLLVAHLKSRRSAPLYDDPATGLKGDEVMRRGEAALLRRAMTEAATADGSQPVLAMGDMNDSPNSMPVRALLGPRPAKNAEPAWQLLPLKDYLGDAWTSYYQPGDTYNRHDYMIVNRALLPLWDASSSFLYRQRESDPPELNALAASDHRPLLAVFRIPVTAAPPLPPSADPQP